MGLGVPQLTIRFRPTTGDAAARAANGATAEGTTAWGDHYRRCAAPVRGQDLRLSPAATMIGRRSTRLSQFGVLERWAGGPPRRTGEFIEERDVISVFRRLAHHFVDLVGVRPDENPPAIALDAVEDDRRRLCRASERLVTKTPFELGHEAAQLIVRKLRDVAA